MRVTDLIPWKHARGSEPAGRDPIAMLQNDVNRAVADFLRPFGMPFSGWPASLADNGSDIQVDVAETDKEVKVAAELPGLDEAKRRQIVRSMKKATSCASEASVASSVPCLCPTASMPMQPRRPSRAVF